MSPDFIVGPTGDFSDIHSALNDARVVTGTKILVQDGLYESTGPIVIEKSVVICGESRHGTVFKSMGGSVFVIMTDHVKLIRLTVENGICSVAPSIKTVHPDRRLVRFHLLDSIVKFCHVGISLRANNFNIGNVVLVHNPIVLGSRTRVGVVIFGSQSASEIDSVTLENSEEYGNTIMFLLTAFSSEGSENQGTLTIAYCRHVGHLDIFYSHENFLGQSHSFNLVIYANQINESDSFIYLYDSVGLSGEVFGSIEVTDNVLSNSKGLGLIAIDGPHLPNRDFRSSVLQLFARGNVLGEGPETSSFVDVPGTSGSVCRYDPGAFSAPTVNVIS